MKTGKIIALEGIDGSGKTSLWENLRSEMTVLHPGEFVFTREPSDSGYRDIIKREINLGDEVLCALLFAADHRRHIEQVIKPAIAAGKHVITDRYYHSHIAYQTVMLGEYMKHPYWWLDRVYSKEWILPPDYVIYLTVPPRIAEERIRESRGGQIDEYEKEETLTKLADMYSYCLREKVAGKTVRVSPINTQHSQEDIAAKATAIIDEICFE